MTPHLSIYRKIPGFSVAIISSIIFLFSPFRQVKAQDSSVVINVNRISSYEFFKNYEMAFVPGNPDLQHDINSIHFNKGLIGSIFVPPADIDKKIILRFTVANTSDTISSHYFFPGFFYNDVKMFASRNGSVIPLPSIPPDLRDSVSFRLFKVDPHDTLTLVAEISQVKTYTSRFSPRIIHPIFIEAYISELHNSNTTESLITYIFCGLLIMMGLISFANYFQESNKEFIYYAGFALFIGFMLFTKPYYFLRSNYRSFFYESYLDFILQGISICFYMAFMMGFLSTRKNHPFLHKLYKYGIIGLITALTAYTWLHYGTNMFFWQNVTENYITKGSLLIMVIIFLVYAIRNWDDKLLRYLFWGNLFYLFFSLVSLSLILFPSLRLTLPGISKSALVNYETGLFLELAFFLAGLTYKNRREIVAQTKERERLKNDNERKEMEKQLAVMAAHQEERDRISEDMHDELGSGMTTIRLMSEIAKNKMKENVPSEIEKISSSANDVLNKMNAIIWSMNSGNDTVDNLVSYIRAYSLEYFENTPINCHVKMPESIAPKDLAGDKRRNIFLCVKETLNNALKHSEASDLTIDICVDDHLKIIISDNGKGIDKEKLRRFGNGLKNIGRRMERMGGLFSIESENGTTTVLELPL